MKSTANNHVELFEVIGGSSKTMELKVKPNIVHSTARFTSNHDVNLEVL